MSSSPTAACERLARALVAGLRRELCLTPKPGLVDLDDSGSHPDLTLGMMARSIELVGDSFAELTASLARGEPLASQVAIGQEAERRMYARLGTNTHKGAIFLGGLLLAGHHRAAGDGERSLRDGVSSVARELLAVKRPLETHGALARRRFQVGGILQEAVRGLPSVFEVALPAFAAASRRRGGDVASFAMLARLMQTVEDTTALHRCGRAGLERVREDGARLERLVEAGGDHAAFLRERNALYRRMNLTMGGVADLLGVAFGWLEYRRARGRPAGARASRPRSAAPRHLLVT